MLHAHTHAHRIAGADGRMTVVRHEHDHAHGGHHVPVGEGIDRAHRAHAHTEAQHRELEAAARGAVAGSAVR